MDERAFVAGSRSTWERLGESVEAARASGVSDLGAERLKQMHEDYRQAAADLAYAQTHFAGSGTETYLNRLVGRAHGELYGAAPRRAAAVWDFLARGYPRLVRRHWRPVAVAGGILLGATALGFLLAHVDYAMARQFLPEMYREVAGDRIEQGREGREAMAPIAPALSGFIMLNNIQVAIIAFAGGVTFGVLTLYSMFQNGMLLGVLAGMFSRAGQALPFWALIVPHGALELPAIALAGGAGLILGRALLAPGDLPRGEAVSRVAPDSVRLLLGTVPLFVIAGIVEGFITPRDYPDLVKLAVGAMFAALLAVYLGLAGRGAE